MVVRTAHATSASENYHVIFVRHGRVVRPTCRIAVNMALPILVKESNVPESRNFSRAFALLPLTRVSVEQPTVVHVVLVIESTKDEDSRRVYEGGRVAPAVARSVLAFTHCDVFPRLICCVEGPNIHQRLKSIGRK